MAPILRGPSQSEAERRLATYAENRLVASEYTGPLRVFLRQYESPLVLLLIFAAVVSRVIREWTEASIILVIILGSTVFGFAQRYRAPRTVTQLRGLLSLKVTALRDGAPQTIVVRHVVPGDIIVLSAGNLVPADGAVIEARDFLVSQAALTSESRPVENRTDPSPAGATMADRTNAVFVGTSARMLDVVTGQATAYGGLVGRLAAAKPETSFEQGVRKFGYLLMRVMMLIVIFAFMANLFLAHPRHHCTPDDGNRESGQR